MADTVLITLADVDEFRKLSKNYDQSKFDGYVRDIQMNYVESLLGSELYVDLLANSTAPNYVELLNGAQYTVGNVLYNYRGLKRYIVFYFLYLYAKEGKVSLSTAGIQNYEVDYSETDISKKNTNVIESWHSSAIRFGEDTLRYLENNSSKFPKYKSSETSEIQDVSYDFKVLGKSHPQRRTFL